MNNEEEKKRITEIHGMVFSGPEREVKTEEPPVNRIEEALRKNRSLPPLSESVSSPAVPEKTPEPIIPKEEAYVLESQPMRKEESVQHRVLHTLPPWEKVFDDEKVPSHEAPPSPPITKASGVQSQALHKTAAPVTAEIKLKEKPAAASSSKNLTKKTPGKFTIAFRLISFGLIILVGVSALGYGGFMLYKHFSQTGSEMTSEQVLKAVGEKIELPTNENPTIATIADIEPLKEEAFFKNAKVGDKLLIYSKSKTAILFRPSEKRVIEVGPLNN